MSQAQRGVIARRTNAVRRLVGGVACALGLTVIAPKAQAQTATGTTFDIYGFIMADMIFEFGQSNPEWFDALRPSKLPAFEDEFGQNGRFYAGIRQSKIGAKATLPTGMGELKTTFEFDLYGVGPDAGQTTIRPRHMWGEIGQFGAGQTDSPFMDADVFPNMVTQIVSIGEESGSLDQMLGKVADFYEAEVDEAVESLSSLMEPLIMVILGVLIGGLVIAMYLPIFKLGSVV